MAALLEISLAAMCGALLAAALTAWLMFRHVTGISRLLRQRMRSAAAREHLVAKVFDATSEGILVVNRDMRIVEANRAFAAMSGYARHELVGQHPRIMQSGGRTRNSTRRCGKACWVRASGRARCGTGVPTARCSPPT